MFGFLKNFYILSSVFLYFPFFYGPLIVLVLWARVCDWASNRSENFMWSELVQPMRIPAFYTRAHRKKISFIQDKSLEQLWPPGYSNSGENTIEKNSYKVLRNKSLIGPLYTSRIQLYCKTSWYQHYATELLAVVECFIVYNIQ